MHWLHNMYSINACVKYTWLWTNLKGLLSLLNYHLFWQFVQLKNILSYYDDSFTVFLWLTLVLHPKTTFGLPSHSNCFETCMWNPHCGCFLLKQSPLGKMFTTSKCMRAKIYITASEKCTVWFCWDITTAAWLSSTVNTIFHTSHCTFMPSSPFKTF